ncbi:ATP-dependent zinc metalloprotease FtsH [Legionella hackeliae]|uniref:ATP-dependent zinc metalloprotease FtsH n=1 Tax=Legionella hackeliae TaxID=449 RepID=UPI0012E34165
MNDMVKNLFLWLIIAIVLVSVFSNFGPRHTSAEKLSYSKFLKEVDQGMISTVTIEDNKVIKGLTKNNHRFVTYMPMQDDALLGELLKNQVDISGQEKQQESFLLHLFINWFPMLLLIGVWVFFMRQMQGGGGRGAMSFGRSRARLLGEDQVKVTFADVAGVDEAKEEVKELVDFLRDPSKFQNLGGRIPRGVLLVGPPGTGKTLLAKAVAGEAKVPFFTISGSDFVEMFVGVGASRVRDMFEQAKKHAPCIIFIDEIDAVGRHRGAGLGGGHDEREQTLNQLLVEMDGFEGNEGVIVVSATNRPDVLDPALLRPGRFDRQVVVPLPDIRGREHILKVHLQKVPIDKDVEILPIARGTPGFSGADLANLVNEAALFAARANKRKVGMIELDKAKDKIMMGAERRSMVMDENEKKLTAYHEAGHAIVGLSVPEHDPVYKVTIIPRGRALGVTMFLPEQDRYSHSKRRLESQLSSLFGGRIAEELIFGTESVTTGASNDIMRATEIARKMVTTWGLSNMGPLTFGEEQGEVFLGRTVNQHKEISDKTAQEIDVEVKEIVDRNYQRAKEILLANMEKLHLMADGLIKYETIDAKQIQEIMSGQEPSPPADWEAAKLIDKDKQGGDTTPKTINGKPVDHPASDH